MQEFERQSRARLKAALSELQGEALPSETVQGELTHHLLGEVSLSEYAPRDVHAHAPIPAETSPLDRVRQRSVEHPLGELTPEAMVLRGSNQPAQREAAAAEPVDAQQGLNRGDLTCLEVNLGLVDQSEITHTEGEGHLLSRTGPVAGVPR
ncbi:unannotated protein [freshwater metagenome]|uniref:Unannotated protein n=1 Tax=freshwater metagenome TaxID=449393 RepID=A0A6J7RFP4_9ZZZZ